MSATKVTTKPTQGFFPLSEMENILDKSPSIPYEIKFSLQPYLDTLKSKMGNACDYTKSALAPVLEHNHKYLESHSDNIENIVKSPQFKTIMSMVVPSMLFSNELSYIAPPFKKSFLVKTPSFESFLQAEGWEAEINMEDLENKHKQIVAQAGIHILNSLYNQNIPTDTADLFCIRNKTTGLVKYHRLNIKTDFVKVEVKGELPKLTQAQIDIILKNYDDTDLWLKYLPVNKFVFSGFCVGNLYDVTDIQVLSNFKQWLNYSEDLNPSEFFKIVASFIKSYLSEESIEVGNIMLDESMSMIDANIGLTGETEFAKMLAKNGDANGIYDHLLSAKRVLYIEDLKKLDNPSKMEKKLIKRKFRSFLISPMLDENGDVLAVLELGSTHAGAFNSWSAKKLLEIFNQLKLNFDKYKVEYRNRITGVIQKNFTSIHPSVAWKFEEVAQNYYMSKQSGLEELNIAPIIFNDVFPLYGQSDIVNSSTIRNELIKSDLIDNVVHLIDLLNHWMHKRHIHLIEAYKLKLEDILAHLEKDYISSDETRIVTLITTEIHPLLDQCISRYKELNDKHYKAYLSELDDELHIIYKKRKDFERSVNKLNSAISEYMEAEESKMQNLLPHYFEKYKTDGVEYNLYLGSSLLENDQFTQDDLRNFKLWQLVSTCDVSRLVHDLSPQLHVPLRTAELIFVYNHSLSIRFRMDEKKFDVDGAYNVRYEILKKRIDKATIKSTGERLTASGKIAIVYLSDKDKAEYLDFLSYLISKNYIETEIEDHELNDLQGAEGLHALRITVRQNAKN